MTAASQTFVFVDIPEEPVPSLLRGFSAPVKLDFDYRPQQLLRLMRCDSDGFCRWDASQQLGLREIEAARLALQKSENYDIDPAFVVACKELLEDQNLDPAMVALMLQLPSEAYLAEIYQPVDVHALHAARMAVRCVLASQMEESFWNVYLRCESDEPYACLLYTSPSPRDS